MIKFNAIFFTLFCVVFTNAQSFKILTSTEAETIKNNKITIVAPNEEALEDFKTAVEEIWNYSIIEDFIIGDGNLKNEDKSKLYLKIVEEKSYSMKHHTHSIGNTDFYFRNVSTGYALAVSYGGNKKALIKTYVPIDSEIDAVTTEVIYFGLSALQTQLNYVKESGAKNSMKYGSFLKEQGPQLKNKELYVLSSVLSIGKKATEDDILSEYSGEINAVTYEKWSEAIINKEKGIAYLMPVPFPIGGNYMFQYWIVDAETGNVLGVQQKSVGAGNNLAPNVNAKIMSSVNDILLGK